MTLWQDEQKNEQRETIKQILDTCLSKLEEPVKLPITVACKEVLRGILIRSKGSVNAQGDVRLHNRDQTFHIADAVLTQISLLCSAIQRSIYDLQVENAVNPAYLRTAEELLSKPANSTRFPYRFFPSGPELGHVCGEIFICEKYNLVFNLHAYQDNHQNSYTATETVSTKITDPVLFEVWQQLDSITPLF